MLDAYKELTPVIYGESAVKYLYHDSQLRPETTCFRTHWHDRIELLRVVYGEMYLQLDEEQYLAKEGDIVLIGPGTLHYAMSGPIGVIYHTVMFDIETFFNATAASEKYLSTLCNTTTRFSTVSSNSDLVASVDRLISILQNTEKAASLFAVSAVYEILGNILLHCADSFRPVQKGEEHFREILEYINENYTSKISVKDISKYFNYNETYFCRRFKEATGMTVMKYIQSLRLESARKLLQKSTDEIGHIAWHCGFSDISYFSNCFKKEFGYTPSEFRNKGK